MRDLPGSLQRVPRAVGYVERPGFAQPSPSSSSLPPALPRFHRAQGILKAGQGARGPERGDS